ncbi:MAG: NADH:flavin oxidoreductase [Promethearchaeota archaeon]
MLDFLFKPGKIGTVLLENRIIRSATWSSRASEDGRVTDDLIKFYEHLAKGGVGLIITGYIAVDPSGAATPRMMCLFDDSYNQGQRRLVKAVHEHGSVKIAAQIAHTGSQVLKPGVEMIGPSPFRDPLSKKMAREMSLAEIESVIRSFIEAGLRAYDIGYDMLQLHCAHGYLLSDFLSPEMNKRTDDFGGNLVNRIRIIKKIIISLRDELNKDFPIMVKLNTHEYLNNGLTFEEGKIIAKELDALGVDAIEPSVGRVYLKFSKNKSYPTVKFDSKSEENYFLSHVRELKPLMNNAKMILMGGVRDPLQADQFIKQGITNFISMSRPLICEPDLPKRWKEGNLDPPICNNCNACLFNGMKKKVSCVIRNDKKLEKN